MQRLFFSKNFSIHKAVVGPFQCNCYAIVCEQTGAIALVDPGDETPVILKMLEPILKNFADRKIVGQIKYLFQTHGHLDHIGATRDVREAISGKICLHRNDEPLYKNLKMQGEMFGLKHYRDPLDIDIYFEHEQIFQLGKLQLQIIHIPGHSPGSVGLRLLEDSAVGTSEILWSGDTLFFESVGRTDLWQGNQSQMFRSIQQHLFQMEGDTKVLPGHGPETTIKHEIDKNPFVGKFV